MHRCKHLLLPGGREVTTQQRRTTGAKFFTVLIFLAMGQLWMPSLVMAAGYSVSLERFYKGSFDAGLRIKHLVTPDYKNETLLSYSITISRYKYSEGADSRQTLASYSFSPATSQDAALQTLEYFDENAGELEKGAEYRYQIRQVVPYVNNATGVSGIYERTVEHSFTGGAVGGTVFRDTSWTGEVDGSSAITVEEGSTLTLAPGFVFNITGEDQDWVIYGKLVAQGARFNDAYGTTFEINVGDTSQGLVFEGNTTSGETRGFEIKTLGVTAPVIISGNQFLKACAIRHWSPGNISIENNNALQISIKPPDGQSSGIIKIRNNTIDYGLYLTGLTGYESAIIEDNLFSGNSIEVIDSNLEVEPGLCIVNNKKVPNIALKNVSAATIKGNEITGCYGFSLGVHAGIQLTKGSRNVISDNVLWGSDIWRPYYNAGIGLGFPAWDDESYATSGAEVTHNRIVGNQIAHYGTGIMLGSAENNVIVGNSVKLCRVALHLGPFVDDTYLPAATYGASHPRDNTVANNKLVKDTQLPSTAQMVRIQVPSSECINTWNTGKEAGANVVGGPYLGGNFWSDHGRDDQDGDLIGDAPYVIDTLNKDNLPLIMPVALTLSAGNLNPTDVAEVYGLEGEFDYDKGRKNVVASHLTLTTNELDAWNVTGLTFRTSGAGNEKEDIAAARLYLNSVGADTLLGQGTFAADNGDISFLFNVAVPKDSSVSMILAYDFKPERAFPCNDYRTKIDMSGILAVPTQSQSGKRLPVPPDGAIEGAIRVKRGDIVKSEGDHQYGEAEDPAKNKPLDKPLKLRVQWQHPSTIEKVTYEITSAAAYGAFLGGTLGTLKTSKALNADGYVEEQMTLGTQKGQNSPYLVQVSTTQKGASCDSSWAPPVFTAWGQGLDLGTTSQYDNPANGDKFGTFVSNIKAENKFTLTIDMTPNYAVVDEVLFTVGSQTVVGTMVIKDQRYEAVFDMAAFTKMENLTVTVKMTKDGTQVEQQAEYNVKCLQRPSWVDAVGKICNSESYVEAFDTADGAYTFTFNYPTNFAWSDYVPSSVGLLGGLENDLDIEFSANAAYKVDETSIFGATVKGQPKILGEEFALEGGLSGDFDPNFAFQRGNGALKANFAFDLPSKGFSKTFLVYGVPITAAVDLSGNVEIFVRGSAVLNRQLEFEEISVAPGTTVTGNVTISLSAVFGLAKIAATGSPTATVEIELKYTSASGTTTTWQGEIIVPITVVGSIFWGLGNAELCSTQLGPWTFPSGASGALAPQAFRPLGIVEGPAVPRLLSTSALAISGEGTRMSVWIDDRTPDAATPDPDVFYRFHDGSAWGDPAPLIGAASTNSEWETDPATVFAAGGKALACWTANKGDKSLGDGPNDESNPKLDAILSHQDIACSLWNGSAWGTPIRVIDDLEADGTVRLAYDGANQKVLAVWVHNADEQKRTTQRTAWKLLYAFFDPAANEGAGGFTVSAVVPGTDAGQADLMPAIAADGDGNALLLWARDDDGQFYTENAKDAYGVPTVANGTNLDTTNSDSRIVWSRLTPTGWSQPLAVAEGGSTTKLAPSVAFSPDGKALAVWTEKETVNGSLQHTLMYAVLDVTGGTWSTPAVIAQNLQFIEDPKAVVDTDGKATVLWRAYSGKSKGGGALFSSSGQMPVPVWSGPKQINYDDTVQWQADAAVDGTGKVYTIWTAYDPASGMGSTGSGFGGGVNVVQESPASAALTGVYADQAVDSSGDGLYEALQISVGVNIIKAGNYEVRADLYHGDRFLFTARLVRTGLAAGDENFFLSFPGGILSDQPFDGPYSLKNVIVLDENDTPVQTAFAAAPTFATAAYEASRFVSGPLTLDKTSYVGTQEQTMVTLTDPLLNTNAGDVQTVAVRVASARNAKGFLLALTETGADTGVFQGSLGFNLLATSAYLRQILVADHDLIQIVYDDPNLDYRWVRAASWRIGGAGDINGDGQVDMADAVIALQVGSLRVPAGAVAMKEADVDADGKIGMPEAIYVLQRTAGVR